MLSFLSLNGEEGWCLQHGEYFYGENRAFCALKCLSCSDLISIKSFVARAVEV